MTTTQTTSLETEPATARQVVERFLSALERLDYDAAIALAGDDIRWVNYPVTSARNKAQFDKALRGMFRHARRFEVQYRDIHERGNGVVYTDRIDIFEGGGIDMTLPVQGEFRVKDGVIVEWVDRFSILKVLGEIGKSLPGIIRFRLAK